MESSNPCSEHLPNPTQLNKSRTISTVSINKTSLLNGSLDQTDKFVTNFIIYFRNFLKNHVSEQHTVPISLSGQHIAPYEKYYPPS